MQLIINQITKQICIVKNNSKIKTFFNFSLSMIFRYCHLALFYFTNSKQKHPHAQITRALLSQAMFIARCGKNFHITHVQ